MSRNDEESELILSVFCQKCPAPLSTSQKISTGNNASFCPTSSVRTLDEKSICDATKLKLEARQDAAKFMHIQRLLILKEW